MLSEFLVDLVVEDLGVLSFPRAAGVSVVIVLIVALVAVYGGFARETLMIKGGMDKT